MGPPPDALATALYSIIALGTALVSFIILGINYVTDHIAIDYLSALIGVISIVIGGIAGFMFWEAGIFGYTWEFNQGIILYSAAAAGLPILLGLANGYKAIEASQ